LYSPRGYLAVAGLAAEVVSGAPRLTPRETECLQWIASGESDCQISDRLSISEATVRFHLQRAKKKFGVRTRAHAVALAILAGYVY
jgi:DNA-binding CsgD family transcriptional regulator